MLVPDINTPSKWVLDKAAGRHALYAARDFGPSSIINLVVAI
jgi:hypothetical protein